MRRPAVFSTSSAAMRIRNASIYALGLLLFASVAGCGKSDTSTSASNSKAPSNEPIATVHWIGSRHLEALANAAGFLKIWRLPESERLRAQTLDKLALAPWASPPTNTTIVITNTAALVRANPSASLLRPLLDDLVKEECYLEMRDAGGATCQLALAVRLDAKRGALWENNLASVFESAAGARRTNTLPGQMGKGWKITSPNKPSSPLLGRIELERAGEWTVLGLAPEQNKVFTELVARVQRSPDSFSGSASSDWLQTAFDLPMLSAALSWALDLPQDCPRVSLAVTGDGTNVVTRGQFHFAKPLPEIEPWNIPTNIIHEPLHSFTAVQGVKPWISSWSWWQNLHASSAPNQLFFWAQSGSPFLDYAAAPLADAPKVMSKLGAGLMDTMNPILASNRVGKWERTGSDGVAWARAPIIAPLVHSVSFPQGNFIFAGLSPLAITNSPPPTATLHNLLSQHNVTYFDRELTGPRVEAWMYISQLFRIIFRREQLPAESASIPWLKAVAPLLGSSATTARKTSQTDLSLSRTSTVGCTAVELHLLADWLESPQFPRHLHSTLAKFPPLPPRRTGQNGEGTLPGK